MFNLSLNLIKEIDAAVLTAISGVVQSNEQVFAWMPVQCRPAGNHLVFKGLL
jgi:hypothetical protein